LCLLCLFMAFFEVWGGPTIYWRLLGLMLYSGHNTRTAVSEVIKMFRNLISLGHLDSNGFRTFASRLIATLALGLILPVAASAYTVVLRNGSRIEVPGPFTVTLTTFTYEVAPSVNITLQMTSINIEATERANGEPRGSLLKRAQQQMRKEQVATPVNSQTRPRRKTITTEDLLATRQARLESERNYERRRRELGLPSLSESRRLNAEEEQRVRERARLSQEGEARSEAYWRARATELRTQMLTLDAQSGYLRSQLAQLSDSNGSYNNVTTIIPHLPSPVILGPTDIYGQPVIIGPGGYGSPVSIYSSPDDRTREREALVLRLHEVEAARAALHIRWRLLEEEAQRAGAQPGWLRP